MVYSTLEKETLGAQASQAEERCECGRLLWKITKSGLELKCNRCKRIHLVKFGEGSGKIDLCQHDDA